MARGLYRATFPAIAWQDAIGATEILYLARPLDRALAYPALAPGAAILSGQDGSNADLVVIGTGHEFYLEGVARFIPRVTGVTRDGVTATGWEGADGWDEFLLQARDSAPLVWYPDRTDLSVSVACYLAPTLTGEKPEPEFVRFYRMQLGLVALAPFTGY